MGRIPLKNPDSAALLPKWKQQPGMLGVRVTFLGPAAAWLTDIRRLFDAYGPQRCYWGTDMTNGFGKATYKQRITHFTEELPFLSEQDKDWIMGRAIVARLGWT
jgi:hypothetical protein